LKPRYGSNGEFATIAGKSITTDLQKRRQVMQEDFDQYLQEILFTFLRGLDVILTGKSPAEAIHTSVNQIRNVRDMIEDGVEYYLSDGGYSRIFIGLKYDEDSKQEVIRFSLTDNSTSKVKLNWNHSVAVEIRRDIVNFLTTYLAQLQLEEEET
jgi:hypothetical protein